MESKKTIVEWSIDRCGISRSDYFQGAGLYGYDEVFVGIGRSEKEAADDAAEQAALSGIEIPAELEKEIGELPDDDELLEIEREAMIDNVGAEPEPEYRIALYPYNGCGPIVKRSGLSLADANNLLSAMLDDADRTGADVSDLVPSGDCAQGEIQYDGGVSDRDGILSVEQTPESIGAEKDYRKRLERFEDEPLDMWLYFAIRVNFASEPEHA